MKKIQEYVVSDDGIESSFFIIDYEDDLRIPIFCPICRFVMRYSEDSDAYQMFGCCIDCEMKFAQPNRDKWIEGWRPNKKDVNVHRKNIQDQSLNLFLCEDNN
jgi:hypothetical protein